jgi:hypothetical protein
MYEGWTRLNIVFLTHLAIVTYLPSTNVMYAWLRGILQASVVLGMHGASEGTAKQFVEYAYWAALAFWVWLKVEMADKGM